MAAWWWSRHRAPILGTSAVLVVATLAALAFTFLQAVPLPCEATDWLAPESARQMRLASEALGGGQATWCPLSRDPGATWAEVVKGLAIVSVLVASWLFSRLGRRHWVFAAVAFSILAMAFVALSHAAVSATAVFGLHPPVHARPRILLAPLLNENNLGGFLAMGVPLLLALALAESAPTRRLLWLLGTVVVAATAVLSLSRGAIAALVAGPLALLVLRLATRTSAKRGPRQAIPALVAGLAGVGGASLGVYAAAAGLQREVEGRGLEKLELAAKGLSFAMESPWLGVGRGAFSAGFVAIHGTTTRTVYPENLVVQWTSEWGFPLAALLLAVLVAALFRVLRASPSLQVCGGMAALVTAGLQNMVDFGLELLGPAVVVSALVGAVTATRSSDRHRRAHEPRGLLVGAPAPVLSLVLGVAAVAATAWPGMGLDASTSDGLRHRLIAAMDRRDRGQFREILEYAVRSHPSEPAFALLAGAEAVQHRDPAAPRWLSRAMCLAPGWSSPHLEAARWLWGLGRRDQALLEIREAATLEPQRSARSLLSLWGDEPNARLALRAAPRSGAPRQEFLDAIARGAGAMSPVAEAVDRVLIRETPNFVAATVRTARRAVAEGHSDEALGLLREVVTQEPSNSDAHVAVGEALIVAGRPEEAAARMTRAAELVEDPRAVLRIRARAETAAGNAEAMRATITELRSLSHGSASELAAVLGFRGRLERTLGNRAQALASFEQAHRISPSESSLREATRLAEELGDLARAFRGYAALCEMAPDRLRYCEARDRLAAGRGVNSPLEPRN